MVEAEIKAKLQNRAETEERLRAEGFLPEEDLYEEDLYFNGSDRDFHITDEALRLRVITDRKDGRSSSVLTYKGPKIDGRSQTRTEHETIVSDGAETELMLEALGYSPVFRVCKARTVYRRGEISACIDVVEDLGTFIELEEILDDRALMEASVERLHALLPELGIDGSLTTRHSYLELLMSEYSRQS